MKVLVCSLIQREKLYSKHSKSEFRDDTRVHGLLHRLTNSCRSIPIP